MPRLQLENGGYVAINDSLILEVGHPEFGCTSVELQGLDELDDVVFLLANNELPEEMATPGPSDPERFNH